MSSMKSWMLGAALMAGGLAAGAATAQASEFGFHFADRQPTFRLAQGRDTNGWPAIKQTATGFPDAGISPANVGAELLRTSAGPGLRSRP